MRMPRSLSCKPEVASYFVFQEVDQPWPLTLVDLKGRKRKIFLDSGDMLLYESAKVPHGRQFPFSGTFYDNLFVHFYPL